TPNKFGSPPEEQFMNRRKFIAKGTLAGISIPSLGVLGQLPLATTFTDPADFKLNEISIQDLQRKMQNGELTSKSITEIYLNRIEAIDQKGSQLNAVLEKNPEALKQAETLDL